MKLIRRSHLYFDPKRNDRETSEELFFACLSFLLLFLAALADLALSS